jgi:hypothetical protein
VPAFFVFGVKSSHRSPAHAWRPTIRAQVAPRTLQLRSSRPAEVDVKPVRAKRRSERSIFLSIPSEILLTVLPHTLE